MGRKQTTTCGDANPNGNVAFHFKGSCHQTVRFDEAYRCTGCGGFFHRDCIFKHFELEEGCSKSHRALHQIKGYIARTPMANGNRIRILEFCREGLDREIEKVSFITKKP